MEKSWNLFFIEFGLVTFMNSGTFIWWCFFVVHLLYMHKTTNCNQTMNIWIAVREVSLTLYGLLAYFSTWNSNLSLILHLCTSFRDYFNTKLHSHPWPPVLPSSGSPAELCQLCVDDEIVAVNGVAAALMNCKQWKDEMTSSLRTGNLTMDVRRYGNKGKIMSQRWSCATLVISPNLTFLTSGHKRCGLSFDGWLFPLDWSTSEGITPNQPGQSRMTLNLTAAAPVVIGGSDHHANSCAATETTVRKMSKLNGQADNVSNV